MNRNLASTLAIASTAAAALAFAAMASSNAYADDITIDNTPFISTRTRAEVRADVMGQSEQLRMASSELTMQQAAPASSDYTRAQAKADFLASRNEVSALNSEDSGSSYLARLPRRSTDMILAGSPE